MFFLLASFMMVSLQMSKTENIRVGLPTATLAKQDFSPGMVNIAVDKSGAIFWEKTNITLPELSLVLSNQFRANTNLPVTVSGDKDTRNEAVAAVLDLVRAAGVQKVAFLVSPAPEAAPPK